LKVGTEGTYPPYTFHDAAGNLTGFDVEIARAVAERLGVRAEFVESRWDALIAGLDAKRFDVVVNEVTITDARKAKYDFSTPYSVSRAVLIVRDSEHRIGSFADLKGLRVAQSITSNYAQIARENGAIVVPVDGFEQAISLLTSGRVDATINDSLSYLDFAKHRPDARLRIAASRSDASQQAVLVRKGEPELVGAIDRALADMRADGTYAGIARRYFDRDISR